METCDLSLEKGKLPEGPLRCLSKAIDRTQQLLAQEVDLQDHDQIHSAKSILYAAIEQLGTRGERIFTTQRMLRELLSIVGSQYHSPGHDKQVGLQILEELKVRTRVMSLAACLALGSLGSMVFDLVMNIGA